MMQFDFPVPVLSRNQLDTMHWAHRSRVRKGWSWLFRSKVKAGYDCGAQHAVVTIIGHRNRLLDPDNFNGGCKPILDAMKSVKLIRDDKAKYCTANYEQVQVAKTAEKTVVLVSYVPVSELVTK